MCVHVSVCSLKESISFPHPTLPIPCAFTSLHSPSSLHIHTYCFLYLHSCCCLPAGSEANIIILSTVRSMPSSDFDPEQLRGDRSWSMEHLGFVTDPHQICVGITRSRFGLIVVGECDAWPVCIASCLVWSLHVRTTISS